MIHSFPNIPESEQKKEWFCLWEDIIKNRLNCPNSASSPLLIALSNDKGMFSWRALKHVTEFGLANARDVQKIFSWVFSRIKPDQTDQDDIINQMFAELKIISLLKLLGFKNIVYHKRNDVDFSSMLEEIPFGIEVTYISGGPGFRTQELDDEKSELVSMNIYELDSELLIKLLEDKYGQKERQTLGHGYTESNSIIFIVTEVGETYPSWFDDQDQYVNGKHPIQNFVDTCQIPTIILVPGCNLYISKKLAGKLIEFDRVAYMKAAYGIDITTAIHEAEQIGSNLEKIFKEAAAREILE